MHSTHEYKQVPLQEMNVKKDDLISNDVSDIEVANGSAHDHETQKDNAKAMASNKTNQLIKAAALVGLVFQNTSLILFMKQASITPSEDGKKALTTTVVVMVEFFKITACILEIAYRRRKSGGLISEIREEIVGKPRETMMLLVPAFMYLAQNNLLFIAVANLEAVVYQVIAQLKILTTAGFSILILERKLTIQQWSSLVLLTIGAAVVQVDNSSPGQVAKKTEANLSSTIGLACALLAQCTSGFAGVFCEKMLKGGSSNMSVRNIQLGVPGFVFGIAGVLLTDYTKVTTGGFFQGYTYLTWIVICLHSIGGLLVTVIMKYADNIAKTIAIGISLVVSTAVSMYIFDFVLTTNFCIGGSAVIFASFMYSSNLKMCPAPKPVN
ncbi:hypothetical protein GUITHDRAFT_101787 [Guillardia theta CCMP2712]|uniref:Uncharacterized protein n=1 Tax=Guillardia theta (strain CCMP2712) TaxID=905079 RepID=L1JW74_GUITC|nr:hypothetical protein GUITHDRAFT_101787 [Guillardia theta CCMP2712]EKX52627.1 hypothetical protein GUITHDRAFT_101787 [Guillardia theta CCMP2712]|eukprot:XP_005839607.1 hypothetical protein GUITHDRAFT_101787 [Guillardia theta CCMP2712]